MAFYGLSMCLLFDAITSIKHLVIGEGDTLLPPGDTPFITNCTTQCVYRIIHLMSENPKAIMQNMTSTQAYNTPFAPFLQVAIFILSLEVAV